MRAFRSLSLVVLLAAPTLAQGDEVRRYFGDWLAACRDDGYCSATAYENPNPGGGLVADYVLRAGRHAEQSYWELSFTTVATMGDEWSDFVVSVDGQGETFSLSPEIGAYGSINDFFLLGDKAQRVMDWMMPGSSIAIAFTDTGGNPQDASFSLSGLTAALLWIDEQQGRVGSERVASAAPYGLVPTGSGDIDTVEVPVALLDRHRADPECAPFEELANGRDFTADGLDEFNTLYVLPCWSAAYNFGAKAYVESGGEYYVQYFANYGGENLGWLGSPHLVNYTYDPATRTLSEYNKARGPGDCGSAGSWRWNGYLFRLEEFRYKDCDDGEPIVENGEIVFPIVYTAPPAETSQ